MTIRRHRRYSTEFKIQLVQAYLDGEGSARSIATRHEVPHSLLMVWIKKYEAGDLTRERSTSRRRLSSTGQRLRRLSARSVS